jgi:hypothetical protein
MATKKPRGPADYRSAKTGKFVTPNFAKTHKATTEKEHNRPGPKKPK